MKIGGSKFRGGGGTNKQSPVDNIYIEKYLMVGRWRGRVKGAENTHTQDKHIFEERKWKKPLSKDSTLQFISTVTVDYSVVDSGVDYKYKYLQTHINLNRVSFYRKYVTLHTQDLDIIILRFRLILYKYLQVPPTQSNNNKLVSVSGPRPRRESGAGQGSPAPPRCDR